MHLLLSLLLLLLLLLSINFLNVCCNSSHIRQDHFQSYPSTISTKKRMYSLQRYLQLHYPEFRLPTIIIYHKFCITTVSKLWQLWLWPLAQPNAPAFSSPSQPFQIERERNDVSWVRGIMPKGKHLSVFFFLVFLFRLCFWCVRSWVVSLFLIPSLVLFRCTKAAYRSEKK